MPRLKKITKFNYLVNNFRFSIAIVTGHISHNCNASEKSEKASCDSDVTEAETFLPDVDGIHSFSKVVP